MTYTIINAVGHEDGPFDLIMLIKKVRSGRLLPEDKIMEDGQTHGEAVPAIMHPALVDIFKELESTQGQDVNQASQYFDLKRLLRAGVNFLQDHHGITVYSGMYAAMALIPQMLLFVKLPLILSVPLNMLINVWGTYLLFGLMWMILRLHRGQPADLDTVRHVLDQRRPEVIRLSAIVGAASFIGFMLGAIPGLFILAVALPSIYYVIEFDMEPWEAIALSRRKLKQAGGDALGVMFGLTVIGFIGIPLVFPPVILLPVVLYAFAKIYDDVFASGQ